MVDPFFVTISWNICIAFRHFIEENKKSIDETWYRRAVNYFEHDPTAFVFSLPFDAGLCLHNYVSSLVIKP